MIKKQIKFLEVFKHKRTMREGWYTKLGERMLDWRNRDGDGRKMMRW